MAELRQITPCSKKPVDPGISGIYTITEPSGTVFSTSVAGVRYNLPNNAPENTSYKFLHAVSGGGSYLFYKDGIWLRGQSQQCFCLRLSGMWCEVTYINGKWTVIRGNISNFEPTPELESDPSLSIVQCQYTVQYITPAGMRYCWGVDSSGCHGRNTSGNNVNSPILAATDQPFAFKKIVPAGSLTFLALSTDGKIYGWGSNGDGQIGDGTSVNRSTPTALFNPLGLVFKDIAGFGNGGLGLTIDNLVYEWGSNSMGQLGDGSLTSTSTPKLAFGGRKLSKIWSNTSSVMGLEVGSELLYYCGYGYWDLPLSGGLTYNRSIPALVQCHIQIKDLVLLGNSAVRVLEKGTGLIWGWGSNSNGQLGDNSTTNRSSPVSVVGGRSFSAIFRGESTNGLATDEYGYLWAWGSGNDGKLGENAIVNRSSPVSVVGNRKFVAASTESGCAMAVEKDTRVCWCWGYNSGTGILGDGTNIMRSSPVSVAKIMY
jgi:alpha-tubulin suppressor-like RCC1 family protein